VSKQKAKLLAKTMTEAYDAAKYLHTPKEMALYLDAWLKDAPDDAAGIARAKGMARVALDTGLSHDCLY
jgi:DNA-binding phage protein